MDCQIKVFTNEVNDRADLPAEINTNEGKSPDQLSHLCVGDTYKCIYASNSQPHDVEIVLGSLPLFNVMFWPTILFITGFVGVFFTSIHLAKEDWKFHKVNKSMDDHHKVIEA